MKSIRSLSFSGLVRKGIHPDAYFAQRFRTGSASPPNQIGRYGFWNGFGAKATFLNEAYLPSNSGLSLVHNSTMAARYSSVILPRSWNGTPKRSNSSLSQPTANVTVTRPLLIQSMVESAFAVTVGCCSGRMAIAELTRIFVV